ncbi:hypothetical protein [Desulfosporosinus sp. FKB]|uniref:hypothetical protein n=1 Tax=Desulfosporosinus sp. FKB TaxID=1969835 RepID=UPI000B49CB20|nr:hypothetical protein [Desulfosporosinus sp. FKB]
MKAVKEKALEKAFVREMNKIIMSREAYLMEENSCPVFDFEAIDAKIAEPQQELIDAVRNNREYSIAEIERLQAHSRR